ncbi:uncharacterized protein LOC126833353 [Adelges cooleyi]|uniref:uncharacterized protein LOC126833353 n=1 Tax=Adelges cooleyi TaxID=133065 RepID=UPI00217FEFC8|nr:uncharacterized protein LOC126833353 [Adelges cooleyi]
MVFKASRITGRILDTITPLLLLICIATQVIAEETNSYLTSVSKQCGELSILDNEVDNDISTSSAIPGQKDDNFIIFDRVRTQLLKARKNFQANNSYIALLYSDAKNTNMKSAYDFDWLPSESKEWKRSYVSNLDMNSKVFIMLSELRDSLHNYSVTLNQMRQFSETHVSFNYTARRLVIDDLCKDLIAVLCEVEAALVNIRPWRHRIVLKNPPEVTFSGSKWNHHPDLTSMQIQDWGVLIKYYKLLKEWEDISNKIKETLSPVKIEHRQRRRSSSYLTTTEKPTLGSTRPEPCLRHSTRGTKHRRRRRRPHTTVM